MEYVYTNFFSGYIFGQSDQFLKFDPLIFQYSTTNLINLRRDIDLSATMTKLRIRSFTVLQGNIIASKFSLVYFIYSIKNLTKSSYLSSRFSLLSRSSISRHHVHVNRTRSRPINYPHTSTTPYKISPSNFQPQIFTTI